MTAPRLGPLQVDEVTADDVVALTMHGALWPEFRRWIEGRGLTLQPWNTETDDLPQFMIGIGIGDELMRRTL